MLAAEYDWAGVFAAELDKAIAREAEGSPFGPADWAKAGRGTGEDEDWWRQNGPGLAATFAYWLESSPDTDVWIAPDGRPGIELALTVTFGTVTVKMFIDLILRMGNALVIVDYKSGSRRPAGNRQLGFYACGIEKAYGPQWRPGYGAYFMNRGLGKDEEKQFFLDPVPLDDYRYSIPYFTGQYEMFQRAIDGGVFIANPGDHCRRCGVNYACHAVGGVDADRYDGRS